MNWGLLKNSLGVSGGATVASVFLGVIAALWSAGLSARGRRWTLGLAAVPLLWPSFLVLNCWMNLLGETGVWRSWFPWSILSLGGSVWVLAMLKWPVTFFLTQAAWSRLDPSLLAVDLRLTGWPLFRWLLWPQARAAVGFAAVITFVLCLSDLSVPSILQVKVSTTEVWIDFNTTFNYGAALRDSWPLVAGPLLLLLCFRAPEIPLSWRGLDTLGPLLRAQLRSGWLWAAIVSAATLAFSVGVPAIQLAGEAKTWRELGSAWAAGAEATRHSLLFAGGSVVFCLAIGAALAGFRAGVLLWLPFFLPGVLLGIALVYLLNRPGLRVVAGSSLMVMAAFAIRYAAISWAGLRALVASLPAGLVDDARLMGAGRWVCLRHLFWPQQGRRALALAYVIYLLTLWDVETLVMIVPPGGETLSLRIFNLLHYGHNGQVNALCLVLLILGAAPLVAGAAIGGVVSRLGARSALKRGEGTC